MGFQKSQASARARIKKLDGLVDWSILFPRSGRPDLRSPLTSHQMRVVREAASTIFSGRFVKMRKSKTRGKAQFLTNTPDYARGALTPFKKIEFNSPGSLRARYINRKSGEWKHVVIVPFSAIPTSEDHLEKLIEEAMRHAPKNYLAVSIFNNSASYHFVKPKNLKFMISLAREDFNRYSEGAKKGEFRPKPRTDQLMVSPEQWMRGLVFTTKMGGFKN